MKSSYLYLLVACAVDFVAKVSAAEQRSSYNVHVPNDLLHDLEIRFKLPERQYKPLMKTDTHVWANLQLTPEEAKDLQAVYKTFDGYVVEDKPTFFINTPEADPNVEEALLDASDAENDEVDEDLEDDLEQNNRNATDDKRALLDTCANVSCVETETAVNKQTVNKKKKATTPYINAVPQCAATIKGNVEVFVMDTYLDPTSKANAKTFKGVRVTHADTSIAPIGCNPHSAYVSAIIFGNGYGVIRKGPRNLFNIPVFICGGASNSSAVYSGIAQAITRAKENKAKGVASVLNWSLSGGPADPILQAAVTEAVKYMAFSVSSGNEYDANICVTKRSPWNVPGVIITGGTTQPGDVTSYFSNCGLCVQAYCPSTYKMFNGKEDDGTSFAAPIKTALLALEADHNPNASTDVWEAAVQARTTTVVNKKYPCSGQKLQVFEKAKVCPKF